MTAPQDLLSLREEARHYIPASAADIQAMLKACGCATVEELFAHIPDEVRFTSPPELPEELSPEDLKANLQTKADKNKNYRSFLGDGLPAYQVHEIVPFVSSLRNLATAYTPYQPERSQGTLVTHWIYQCALAQLTGFEAINTSLYERSTALYEACLCALRLVRKTNTILLCEGLYPGDCDVLETLRAHTDIQLKTIPLNPDTGLCDLKKAEALILKHKENTAAIAFPQTNHLGLCEDVHALTDLAHAHELKAIAVIDPMLLATGALTPPNTFGKKGADMIVGEGQHLAIGPNFGGPGLGIFGVRFNEHSKNNVRATPGRYVGKATDANGRDCFTMVLSTREQHIRKEKATSNICSNQAFLATLAGAAILARGDEGMSAAALSGHKAAQVAIQELIKCTGVSLAYPQTAFFNETTLALDIPTAELIQQGREHGLHIGVDISDRIAHPKKHLLKISFSDIQTDEDIQQLIAFFKDAFKTLSSTQVELPSLPKKYLRKSPAQLPSIALETLKDYYEKLGECNVSPDTACYPLGSCTMKYNPLVNDWAAGLPGFTNAHPQAPTEDVQGCLEILFEIQEWFKKITGLAGITTQPVAGAQGELLSLKLFQAYHHDRKEEHRTVVFIPKSAHGTNFATATMANTKIVLLEANDHGQIDFDDFCTKLEANRNNLCGLMVTNPNTSGVFESQFKIIADKVHEAGGLVFMDGANMNAIASWVNLDKLGVDAVHNNLHKTWTIPHGGGGPGDAIVGVSSKLVDFLPGLQITKAGEQFVATKPKKSIGSFHRHWGNFAHKVRCYTYLARLGKDGVRAMAATAVLSARYLFSTLGTAFPTLPAGAQDIPRMHEFILTLTEEDFSNAEAAGTPKANIIPQFGKLFLDYGFHAPTVAFPEVFGLMIEPTESYTKAELDRFQAAVLEMQKTFRNSPGVIKKSPRFTPIDRVDEVGANRNLCLSEKLTGLPKLHPNRLSPSVLSSMELEAITEQVLEEL